MRELRVAASVLLAGICFLLTAVQAHACSCGKLPSPTEALAQSAKVFSGKVVQIRGGDGGAREPALLSGYIEVEFEVYAVWKGEAYATMFIETAWWSGSCGVEFYLGQEWLVYSFDGVTAHPCGRTRYLDLAQDDLAALGDGTSPALGTIEPFRQSGIRIERIGAAAPQAGAEAPAPEPAQNAALAWLSLGLLLGVALAVLGLALRGTTQGARVFSALAGLLRSGRDAPRQHGGGPRR